MQQKWSQNFDGEPMADIPQKFLNAGCDAPECNPTVCRKVRAEHEL